LWLIGFRGGLRFVGLAFVVGFLAMVGSFRYLRFLLVRGFSSFTTVGASLMG
jgi:hypothetical protein